MMKYLIKFIIPVIIPSFIIFNCHQKTEHEAILYHSKIEQIIRFKNKYTSFKTEVEIIEKNFRLKWDSISKINNQEDKTKKMSEINNEIDNDELYKALVSYEINISLNEKLQSDLSGNNELQYRAMIKNAVYSGSKAILEAKKTIEKTKPLNKKNAVDLINKANIILSEAIIKLKKVDAFVNKSKKTQ